MPDDDEDRGRFARIRNMIVGDDDDSDDSDEESDDESPGRSWNVATNNSSPQTVRVGGGSGESSGSNSDYIYSAGDISGFSVDADQIAQELDSISGSRTYQTRGSDQSHVIRASPSGRYYSATKYGDITEGRKLNNMDENTIEEWFFNEATNIFTRRRIGEAFAGETNDANGMDGLIREVIDHVADRLDERVELGEDEAQAFNNHVDEWPREAQAMLCSEELNRDRHSSYQADCRGFAEAYDVRDLDLGQTELDLFYSENPYSDGNLSQDEADVVMVLRANGEDTEGVLDRIDNYESFIDWYTQIGSVEQALQAHEYDNVFDPDEMAQLAPPDEWPADMNASNIRHETCLNCTRRHLEVVTEDGERTWMLSGGEMIGGEVLDDGYLTGQNFMCDSCFSSWEDNKTEVVIAGQDATVKIEGDQMLRRVVDDSAWDDYTNLTGEEESIASAVCRQSIPPDYSGISPDPSFGDSRAQDEAIAELMDPNTEFENGTAYVANNLRRSPSDHTVFLSRENAELAQEVKQAIDSNLDYTATEQAA